MKTLFNKLMTLTGVILVVSCVQNPLSETTAPDDSLTGKSLRIRAIAVQKDSDTKTMTETGAEVLWQPNDQISVFYGSTLQGTFQYNGTSTIAQAEFEGSLSVVTGAIETPIEDRYFWGVYPHRTTNTCNGSSVTTIVPDHQIAITGSFDPAALVTVAQSSGLTMAFYNVCGGIKFSLTQPGIRQVVFSTNDDTPLCGTVTVTMDGEGHPKVSSISNPSSTIYLTMPDEKTFEIGKWYYMTCLPGVWDSGYTITLHTDTKAGSYVQTVAMEAKRSVWGRLDRIDENIVINYVSFADENVKSICVANWDTDGDGELSFQEAAAVDDIKMTFYDNKSITSFDELRYFTGLSCISSYAFDGCSNLSKITLPNGVKDIGAYAFFNCTSLTAVTIPYGVTNIDRSAFSSCSGLTGDLTIPNSVTCIGEWAFHECNKLTGLTLSTCVTSIGDYAFDGCSSLAGDLTIPGSTSIIGSHAFYGCSGLTGLTIQDGVVSIGNSAFYGCAGLTGDLTIPVGVTTIEEHAFSGCSGLTGTLTIPGSVTSIGDHAFYYCCGLTKLTIQNGVSIIGDCAFDWCYGLSGDLVIPDSVTIIGSFAFAYCYGLKGSLTISDSVTCIKDCAFYHCSGLTGSLIIPKNITSIGKNAFNNCDGLTGLTIQDGVAGIEDYAFSSCSGITGSITIPGSVTSIGNNAFEGCKGISGLTILDGVTSIGDYAFSSCSGITGLMIIPGSVTSIGNSAFEGCKGISGLTIKDGVTSIGSSAFYDCDGLTDSLTIPGSVTRIGSYVFSGNCHLKRCSILSVSPPTLGTYVFTNSLLYIYVPAESVDEYKLASGWSAYANKIYAIPE